MRDVFVDKHYLHPPTQQRVWCTRGLEGVCSSMLLLLRTVQLRLLLLAAPVANTSGRDDIRS
jgi:hypothetical protein